MTIKHLRLGAFLLSLCAVVSSAIATAMFWAAGGPYVGCFYLGITALAAAFTWHTHRLLQQAKENEDEMEEGS